MPADKADGRIDLLVEMLQELRYDVPYDYPGQLGQPLVIRGRTKKEKYQRNERHRIILNEKI